MHRTWNIYELSPSKIQKLIQSVNERVKSMTSGKVSSQSLTKLYNLFIENNRQAEIKMQAGMSSMLTIAWRMSCSQMLRELHFVIVLEIWWLPCCNFFFRRHCINMWIMRDLRFALGVKLEWGLLPKHNTCQVTGYLEIKMQAMRPCWW